MVDGAPVLLHATAVALAVDDGWAGVLLRGPSGSGKSDLALRLIDDGGRLVADDQVALCGDAADVTLRAPPHLPDCLEVRGLGLVKVPTLPDAPLRLVVDLQPAAVIERLPAARAVLLAGMRVPSLALAAFEVSATAKLRLAVRQANRSATVVPGGVALP